ncbi:MAG: cytochrome P450 [Bacteroidota bacterium]
MAAPTTLSSPPTSAHTHWLFGDIPELRRDMLGWMLSRADELGTIYSARLFRRKLTVITEPEYVKYVLQDNNRNYKKSFAYDILKLFLGNGLLTSESDFWLRQRRLAQPAFHRKRLNSLAHAMIEESMVWAERWNKLPADQTIDVHREMMDVTMRIVARTLFSTNVESHVPTISKNLGLLNDFAMDRVKNPIPPPTWLPTPRHLAFRRATESINQVLFGIIEARRGKTEGFDDLLSMLMEARDADTGEQMNDLQLRDECMTIFVAGHETTALTMSWIFHLLAHHPEVQELLAVELQEVLGDRPPILEDLKRLVYTRYVIDEALRLYPPAWVFGRLSLGDDSIGGYHIEQDTNVLLLAYQVHRRPDLWDRPQEFWPGRWATEKVKNRPRFAYFPFGGGPRLCIGNNFALMEMTFLLAALARGNRFQAVSPRHPRLDPLITLRSLDPIEVRRAER